MNNELQYADWFKIDAEMAKDKAQRLANQLNEQKLQQQDAFQTAISEIQGLDAPTADVMGDKLIKAGALEEGLRLKQYAATNTNQEADNARQALQAAATFASMGYGDAAKQILAGFPQYQGLDVSQMQAKPDLMSIGEGRVIDKRTGQLVSDFGSRSGGEKTKFRTIPDPDDPTGERTMLVEERGGKLYPADTSNLKRPQEEKPEEPKSGMLDSAARFIGNLFSTDKTPQPVANASSLSASDRAKIEAMKQQIKAQKK